MSASADAGVVIVGASLAGASVATELRRQKYGGPIALVGEESHLPYDRPPLSKQYLTGAREHDRLALNASEAYDDLGISMRLAQSAHGLDLEARTVAVGDDEINYRTLVVATGVRPRSIPGLNRVAGAFSLRTVEDAQRLRSALVANTQVVVIGGGFQGVEVAASARSLGCRVAMVYPEEFPMQRQVGSLVGAVGAERLEYAGIRLYPGRTAHTFGVRDAAVQAVALSDGTELACGAVVVSIGSQPRTDWLATSGLTIGDGVEVDAYCLAAPDVYAAGDVARWWHAGLGRSLRIEHRFHAAEQGRYVARHIAGTANGPFTATPYFWSDQLNHRIQGYGLVSQDLECVVTSGDPVAGSFVASFLERGCVTGVICWNAPKELNRSRLIVDAGLAALGASNTVSNAR